MSLLLRNLLFTVVVPGSGAVMVPLLILTVGRASPGPVAWLALPFIAGGAALYLACLWIFATVGGRHAGTVGRAATRRQIGRAHV